MTTPRTEHYERSEGPLHLWQPQRRHHNRRTVTVPKGVTPLVRIIFSEMARQGRRYDDVVEA
ncbi:hypothetical protein, partial [Rhodopseudomonas sp.]|uniref:hypothetical protein n=1 Tax=Rhodopseudomonas sp. TaxID=1078 RepID=UPI003B3B15E8